MNLKLFKKRLRGLYTNWTQHKQDFWSGSDILLVSTPPSTFTSSSSVSHRFYVWLLDYVFSDTIAIFSSKEIHFICNKQKASLLKPLISAANDAVNAELIIHEKAKEEDGNVIMDKVLTDLGMQHRLKYLSVLVSMKKSKHACEVDSKNTDSPLVVGQVVGESPESKCLTGKMAKEFRVVDIKDGLSKFAMLCKVKVAAKPKTEKGKAEELDDEAVESVFWGFRRSDDERGKLITNSSTVREIDIYLQALSKEAEEMILLADVKRLDDGIVLETIKFGDIGAADESRLSFDELNEWVLV